MKITVKLFASFRVGRFKVEDRDYPPGTPVRRIVEELGLSEDQLGVVMVNYRHAALDYELKEGDALALFPLVGGG
ncbi:MoaD/ThiS family protein [Geoalkalibacter subterraneus]|uniref:Molybdenum cofactor biosynthesis protein MoaD n=1 Tax=Geoalkalibacter subterraneus TaxID=483547 RepID=A0A0B5FTC4_9BACT|nr:MoaD/ThiS family protein [Geoalkalibacter subterraneus]AJF07919.1 molybdenum cofactor biosynthesis protein MoaD [Geoalkalibacter subterraneus]